MRNLSENAGKLGDISSASDATNEYVENLKGATEKVGELSGAYEKASSQVDRTAVCGNWRIWSCWIRDRLEFSRPITGLAKHGDFLVGADAWFCASSSIGPFVAIKFSSCVIFNVFSRQV